MEGASRNQLSSLKSGTSPFHGLKIYDLGSQLHSWIIEMKYR